MTLHSAKFPLNITAPFWIVCGGDDGPAGACGRRQALLRTGPERHAEAMEAALALGHPERGVAALELGAVGAGERGLDDPVGAAGAEGLGDRLRLVAPDLVENLHYGVFFYGGNFAGG